MTSSTNVLLSSRRIRVAIGSREGDTFKRTDISYLWRSFSKNCATLLARTGAIQ